MTNGFDKLLRESLTADAAAGIGAECPDAALVAGWFDGTLSHAERTSVEAHAATCSRCQATIAALVRTDRPVARAWWRAPAVQWLVPVAVVGGASLIVWIGVLRTDDAGPLPSATSARFESAARVPAVVDGAAGAQQGSSPGGRAGNADAPPKPAPLPAAAAREKAPDSVRPDREVMAGVRSDQVVEVPALPVELLKQQAGIAAPLPQAPEPIAPPASPASPPAAKADAAGAGLAGQPNVTSSMDATRQFAERAVAQSATPAAGRGSGPTPLIQSPDRSVRWRITGQSQVERSVDGGLSWQTQTTGVNAVLIAGMAPSSNVCWLVGWRGVVLKTTDGGQTWTRVAFPEELNLMAVVADDDKVATVTAAGGRQLHTTDGGGRWK